MPLQRAVMDPAGSNTVGEVARIDLSVVIPALGESENLSLLLPELRGVLSSLCVRFEILVVTSPEDAATARAATAAGARAILQTERGYGGALLAGFAAASGAHILTMDSDLSHPAPFVREIWQGRTRAEVVIASRYTAGGRAQMPRGRLLLSKILNGVFSRGLSLAVGDMSSGFRLYRAEAVQGQAFVGRDFDILQEILVRAFAEGWRVTEVPFHYRPRQHGRSHARVLKFGAAYLRKFWPLWKLRNSIECADYDARAYDSAVWLQRYWQRRRFAYIRDLIAGEGPVLDVGCGSSRLIGALPAGSLAIDILLRKLRYARRFNCHLALGSALAIPVRDEAFSAVLCSQVIEHIPKDSGVLGELCRVLAPGGLLVLGTPDYDRWQWVLIEKAYGLFAPGGYADEHIAHYGFDELVRFFTGRGYRFEASHYIMKGELILAFRKPLAGLNEGGDTGRLLDGTRSAGYPSSLPQGSRVGTRS